MKTASLTPPPLHFVDIAPLAARFDILAAAVLTFISAGQMGRVVRLTHKVRRVVQLGIKFETQNILLRRKLDMLTNKAWRERVLKQLGGTRRLRTWEAAAERNAKPRKKTAPKPMPAWLDTPERRAESERLKAHVRKCARACVSPHVKRDKIRMDFEGEFRLAPLPRREGDVRADKIYTAGSICDYIYNAVPFAEMKSFGPATLWPAEFRAAAEAEVSTHPDHSHRPYVCEQMMGSGPISETNPQSPDLEMDPVIQRDERESEEVRPRTIPTLDICDVIDLKRYTDIFYDPPEPPT